MGTAALGIGAGLVSSLLGGIFGNKPQTTTTDSSGSQTINGTQNLYGTTALTHNYDTGSANLRNALINMYSQNLSQPYDVQGQINSGIQGNNAASNGRTTALNQILASRGLNTSPVAANALIQEQGNRASMNATTINSAPQILQQMFNSRMAGAGGFFNNLAQDTTQQTNQNADSYQKSDTTQHSTQTGSGNMAGGAFSSLGSSLGYMAGAGLFGKLGGGSKSGGSNE